MSVLVLINDDENSPSIGAAKLISDDVHCASIPFDACPKAISDCVFKCVQDGGYSHIITLDNVFGKDVAPRLAALLDVPFISGVCEISSPNTFVRNCYAGSVLETIEVSSSPIVLSVLAHKFPKQGVQNKITFEISHKKCNFEVVRTAMAGGADLANADVVVAGGRSLKSAQNFEMINALANALGGAPAATRDAVDDGYAPNALQVGQSGASVAPKVYIGVGVSGAIQHTCGMREAKTIIAINTDENAPLCEMADYVLNADLFDALPEAITSLQK